MNRITLQPPAPSLRSVAAVELAAIRRPGPNSDRVVKMDAGVRGIVPLAIAALAMVACILTPLVSQEEAARVVQIKASDGWQSTGVRVRAGDHLRIRYIAGEWSPWPGGSYDATGTGGDPRCRCNVMEGVSHAALIGQIGTADPFLVGREFDHVVGESGVLYLRINDVDLHDNSGEIEVLVELER